MATRKQKGFDWNSQKVVSQAATQDPNYARQMMMGAAQGLGDITSLIGSVQGLLQSPLTYGLLGEEQRSQIATPGQQAQAEALFAPGMTEAQQVALMSDEDDIIPPQSLPGGRAAIRQDIEGIPTEGIAQEATRRITRSIPGAVGGASLFAEMGVRELLGLGGKKIAEQMGFDELGQTVFDVGFSLFPNPKKFIETGDKLISKAATGEFTTQKEMVNAAREMGWTEREVAPLVREGWFGDLLSKVSPRGAATEAALERAKAATGRTFELIKTSPAATKQADSKSVNNFVSSIEKLMPELTGPAYDMAERELQTLYNTNMTGRDFVTFWQKLNRHFKDLPELQSLKGPTGRMIKDIDKGLAGQFEMANTLSQRFREVSKKLKPSLVSQLVTGGEVIGGLYDLLNFQMPIKALGVAGGRKLAELMTTNPRFINLTKKMLTSVTAGHAKAAEKTMNALISMVAKASPEAAKEIRRTSRQELENLMASAKED